MIWVKCLKPLKVKGWSNPKFNNLSPFFSVSECNSQQFLVNSLEDSKSLKVNKKLFVSVGVKKTTLWAWHSFLVIKALRLACFHFLCLSRLLLDGAPLIAIHKARYYKRKDGLALGPGPFVTALEYATDTKATVVGKPEKTFFLEALRGIGCEPEEAIMIGDVSRRAQEMPWAHLSCWEDPALKHSLEIQADSAIDDISW